jgi:Ca2+:H+ antiporter
VIPGLGLVVLAATWGREPGDLVLAIVGLVLACVVPAAVHHADVVAHRVGEPFGSLVLAVAVTVIEVGLIVTLMASGGSKTDTLARDTVFAAFMITCNVVVGLSLLVSTLHGGAASFNAEGTATALASVATLATLCLVLPTFTTSEPGPEFSPAQLTFAGIASVSLYAIFVFVQTVRHRDLFLPVDGKPRASEGHASLASDRRALVSLGALLVALVAVVGLAKVESPAVEDAVRAVGAPQSAVGVVIALLVLLPEGLSAVRNAPRADPDELQPRLRLGDGKHRAHDPDRRARVDLAPRVAGARAELTADRAARAHGRRRCAHRAPRAVRRSRRAASTWSSSAPPSSSR